MSFRRGREAINAIVQRRGDLYLAEGGPITQVELEELRLLSPKLYDDLMDEMRQEWEEGH